MSSIVLAILTDLAVDPSEIFFHMVYRIALQNLTLLSSRSASSQIFELICLTIISQFIFSTVDIWMNLEIIGRETILVPKEVEFFNDQHIQNPQKSFSRKLSYICLKISFYSYHIRAWYTVVFME